MENRLIYKKEGPDVQSERLEFSGDGKREFDEIGFHIDQLLADGLENLSQTDLLEILKKIDQFRTDCLNSPLGVENTYEKGAGAMLLCQKLRDEICRLMGLEGGLQLYGSNSLEDGSVKPPKALSAGFLEQLAWYSDPLKSFNDLVASLGDGKLSEDKAKKIANLVIQTGNYHQVLLKGNPEQIRQWLGFIDDRIDRKDFEDQNFLAGLQYEKEHFVFETQFELDFLNSEARALLKQTCAVFYKKAMDAPSAAAVGELFGQIGTLGASGYVDKVLETSGIKEDESDSYASDKSMVYCFVLWSFYKGLVQNPNGSVLAEQKSDIYSRLQEALDKSGLRSELERRKGLSADLAQDFAKEESAPPVVTDKENDEEDNAVENNDENGDFLALVDEGDEADPNTFEVPPKIVLQMSRLRVISLLATALLSSKNSDEKHKSYTDGVLRGLNSVSNDLTSYYKSPEYDGETDFDLDKALDANLEISNFLTYVTDIFANPRKLAENEFDERLKDLHGGHVTKDIHEFAMNLHLSNGLNPTYEALFNLLNGKGSFSEADVKRASAAVALFVKDVLKNEDLFLGLAARFLDKKLRRAEKNIPPERLALLKERSRGMAISQMNKLLADDEFAKMAKGNLRTNYLRAYRTIKEKQNPGVDFADPPEAQIAAAVERGYGEFSAAMTELHAEEFYAAMLARAASHENFFTNFHGMDETDRMLLDAFRSTTNEYGEDSAKSREFCFTLAKELGIMAAGLLLSFGVGMVVEAGLMSVGGRLISAGLMARRLQRIYRFGVLGLKLVSEAGTFDQLTSMLHGDETLWETFYERGDLARTAQRVAAEMAMMGAFHGISFVSRFLSAGSAGRALMALKNAKPFNYGEAVNYVFKSVEGLNSVQAMARIEQMLIRGAKLPNGKPIPGAVRRVLRRMKGDVGQLQTKYLGFINKLQDEGLKKVLNFFVQSMSFDTLAMFLGNLGKDYIKDKNLKSLKEFSAQSVLQLMTQAVVFRGAFTIAGKGVEYGTRLVKTAIERLGAKSPLEAMPKVDGKISELTTKKSEIERQIKETEMKIERSQQGAEASTSVESAQLTQLQTERGQIDKALAELAEVRKMIVDAINKSPMGQFLVPSSIARLLPRGMREALYRDYRGRDGEFLGSDGFVQTVLNDFDYAMGILENAERNILSHNQIIYLLSELKADGRGQFLENLNRLLSNGERFGLKKWIETWKLGIEDVPNDFAHNLKTDPVAKVAEYKRSLLAFVGAIGLAFEDGGWGIKRVNPTPALRRQAIAIASALGIAFLADAAAGSGTIDAQRVASRPAHTQVVDGSFSAKDSGSFAIPEGSFTRMKPVGQKSAFVLVHEVAIAAPKELEAGRASGLFSKNAGKDQEAIFESLAKSGAEKSTIDALKARVEGISPIFRDYVRIFASLDGERLVPYMVVDRDGVKQDLGFDLMDLGENPAEVLATLSQVPEDFMNALVKILRGGNPEVMQSGLGIILYYLFLGPLFKWLLIKPMIGLLGLAVTLLKKAGMNAGAKFLEAAKNGITPGPKKLPGGGEILDPSKFTIKELLAQIVTNNDKQRYAPLGAADKAIVDAAATDMQQRYNDLVEVFKLISFKSGEAKNTFKLAVEVVFLQRRIAYLRSVALNAGGQAILDRSVARLQAVIGELVQKQPEVLAILRPGAVGRAFGGEDSLMADVMPIFERIMTDNSFTAAEIASVRNFIGRMADVRNLTFAGKHTMELKTIRAELGALNNEYAAATAFLAPYTSAVPPLAPPDHTVAEAVRLQYARAVNTVNTYNALQARETAILARYASSLFGWKQRYIGGLARMPRRKIVIVMALLGVATLGEFCGSGGSGGNGGGRDVPSHERPSEPGASDSSSGDSEVQRAAQEASSRLRAITQAPPAVAPGTPEPDAIRDDILSQKSAPAPKNSTSTPQNPGATKGIVVERLP